MKLIIRVESPSNDLYDVEYITLWEWLLRRFGSEQYVRNVREAEKMGLTYEPKLYSDINLPREV